MVESAHRPPGKPAHSDQYSYCDNHIHTDHYFHANPNLYAHADFHAYIYADSDLYGYADQHADAINRSYP